LDTRSEVCFVCDFEASDGFCFVGVFSRDFIADVFDCGDFDKD
jgi:hypothetical protein